MINCVGEGQSTLIGASCARKLERMYALLPDSTYIMVYGERLEIQNKVAEKESVEVFLFSHVNNMERVEQKSV